MDGLGQEENMAKIYALVGDADHAVPILKRLRQVPYVDPITRMAADRPILGSEPERSSFSGIGRGKETVKRNKS